MGWSLPGADGALVSKIARFPKYLTLDSADALAEVNRLLDVSPPLTGALSIDERILLVVNFPLHPYFEYNSSRGTEVLKRLSTPKLDNNGALAIDHDNRSGDLFTLWSAETVTKSTTEYTATTPTGADGGATQPLSAFSMHVLYIKSEGSTNFTIGAEVSPDNTNWFALAHGLYDSGNFRYAETITYTANIYRAFPIHHTLRYFRVKYVNNDAGNDATVSIWLSSVI